MSSGKELPLPALAELYVSLSTHTAPIIQPLAVRTANAQTDLVEIARHALTNAVLVDDVLPNGFVLSIKFILFQVD